MTAPRLVEERCADCRKRRFLIRYDGLEHVCRECANKRDAGMQEVPWDDQGKAWR